MAQSTKLQSLFLISDERIAVYEHDRLEMSTFRGVITRTLPRTVRPFTIGIVRECGDGKTYVALAAQLIEGK